MFLKVRLGYDGKYEKYVNSNCIMLVAEHQLEGHSPDVPAEDWFLVTIMDVFDLELYHKHNPEFVAWWGKNKPSEFKPDRIMCKSSEHGKKLIVTTIPGENC